MGFGNTNARITRKCDQMRTFAYEQQEGKKMRRCKENSHQLTLVVEHTIYDVALNRGHRVGFFFFIL